MERHSRFSVTLDSGAIIALSRGDSKVKAYIRKWTSEEAQFIVPAPVLTETLRGGSKDAGIHHFIRSSGVELAPLSPGAARRAGELLGTTSASPSRAIDAMIVAVSLEFRANEIVTTDPGDISLLAPAVLKVISV